MLIPLERRELKKIEGFKNHQAVYSLSDRKSGLKGFVAIHNTNLGVPVGGTRYWKYSSREGALRDALRLSHAMTYKCAIAGVKHGGGKAVIVGDHGRRKTRDLLIAYAHLINRIPEKFFTGEDVGISESDVQTMLKESRFFIGRKEFAGDPSPYAALSNFYAMQVAALYRFGSESLEDRTVAIKGVGKVGGELVRLLNSVGADIFIADIDSMKLKSVKKKFPDVHIVDERTIHQLKVDIYAPCAMGDEFTEENKKNIRTEIICGAANNQLESAEVGDWFFRQGILYVPDYVANAGGLINVVDELEPGGYKKQRVIERVLNMKKTLAKILALSRHKRKPLNRVADALAEDLFQKD